MAAEVFDQPRRAVPAARLRSLRALGGAARAGERGADDGRRPARRAPFRPACQGLDFAGARVQARSTKQSPEASGSGRFGGGTTRGHRREHRRGNSTGLTPRRRRCVAVHRSHRVLPNLDRHRTGSRAPSGRDGWIDDAATSRHIMTSPIDGLDPAGCELGSRSSNVFRATLPARLFWWPAHSTRPKITADPAAMIPNSASCAQPPRSPDSDGSSTAVRRRDHRAIALVDGQRRGRLRHRRRPTGATTRAQPGESATIGAADHPIHRRPRYHRSMAEVEIGLGKSGRRAYGFDDIAIVPSRRTRDPEDVDISWELDGVRFELPLLASAMDGVVSPATAIEIGRLGGLGVLNLEGLWSRVRGPGHAARGDRPARRREGHPPDAGDLPGADRPRAGDRADPPGP